jgi:hypothetical protein
VGLLMVIHGTAQASANNGESPDKLSQLIPYLKTPFQSNALERMDQFDERIARRQQTATHLSKLQKKLSRISPVTVV